MSGAIDFEAMIEGLKEHFKGDRVNVDQVKDLLGGYKSKRSDWNKFYFEDPHRYTRNLVCKGNGHYNVMLLVWGPQMASSIHDHADAHCFVKVLQGEMQETQYHWPDEGDAEMRLKQTQVYPVNGVTYMNDSLGLHRMENPSHTDVCVSLHVYIPAFEKCQIFDERTAKRTTVKFTFYSEVGVRANVLREADVSKSADSMDGDKMARKAEKKRQRRLAKLIAENGE